MTPLMDKRTFWWKWVAPYALVLAILVWSLYGDSSKPRPDHVLAAFLLTGSCVMLFFVLKRQSREQPDEVLDGGTFLRVTFASTTEDIPISEVARIEVDKIVRLTRIVLYLQKPGAFGDTIAFYPLQRRDSSGRNEVAVSLEGRIARYRAEAG